MRPDEQSQDRTADFVSTEGCNVPPQLNVKLHQRLMLEGSFKPSTLASAMEALHRIRRQRETESQRAGQ